MNHKCKNNWINIAGGQVVCEICGKEYFFTELKITSKEIIHAGSYDLIESNGIPTHDMDMIQYFRKCESEANLK